MIFKVGRRLWQKLSPSMTVKDLQRLLNYQSKFRANAFRCINRYSNWDCYKVKKLKWFLLLWENCLHESAFKFWAFTEIELEYNEFKKKTFTLYSPLIYWFRWPCRSQLIYDICTQVLELFIWSMCF